MKPLSKPTRLYTTDQQLIGDNDGVFKCWYRKCRGHADAMVPVLVIPLTMDVVDAIRAKAKRRVGRYSGSHLDTIDDTLAAVGVVTHEPSSTTHLA